MRCGWTGLIFLNQTVLLMDPPPDAMSMACGGELPLLCDSGIGHSASHFPPWSWACPPIFTGESPPVFVGSGFGLLFVLCFAGVSLVSRSPSLSRSPPQYCSTVASLFLLWWLLLFLNALQHTSPALLDIHLCIHIYMYIYIYA